MPQGAPVRRQHSPEGICAKACSNASPTASRREASVSDIGRNAQATAWSAGTVRKPALGKKSRRLNKTNDDAGAGYRSFASQKSCRQPMHQASSTAASRYARSSVLSDLQSSPQDCFEGLVATARGKHPVPSRTRPLSPVAPMVLRLKTWESRSPPGLQLSCPQDRKAADISRERNTQAAARLFNDPGKGPKNDHQSNSLSS